MENSIVIVPKTEKIAQMAQALRIKNEFISLGFMGKSAFFEVVQEKCPEFKEYKNSQKLHNWWMGRIGDPTDLNVILEDVINTLRHE